MVMFSDAKGTSINGGNFTIVLQGNPGTVKGTAVDLRVWPAP